MSRSLQQVHREARDRWPALHQFLACYLHEDWPGLYGSPEAAISAAIVDYPLSNRQEVAREWWDWNGTAGAIDDSRKVVRALGVNVFFEKPIDARNFMNSVYDQLAESIRAEAGKSWKP